MPPWSLIGFKKILIRVFPFTWSPLIRGFSRIIDKYRVLTFCWWPYLGILTLMWGRTYHWPHLKGMTSRTPSSWGNGSLLVVWGIVWLDIRVCERLWIRVLIVGFPNLFISSDLPGSLLGEHWSGRCELVGLILLRERSTTVFFDQQPIQVVQMLINRSNRQLSCACRSAGTDSTFVVGYSDS